MNEIIKNKPKVSIGLPVYNGEKFIREALDSLLVQSFTDFELIISDNGSSDGTEAVCREYAARDARIRYVRWNEDRGGAANFAYVLDEARGEYFMWAAHDDRWHVDYIKFMSAVLDSDEDVGLVFSAMVTKNLLTGDSKPTSTGYISSSRVFLKILFRIFQNCPSLIYGLHRRKFLEKIDFQNFDYFDVYMSYWYELNSSVRVVPLFLYTAGTKGARVPYSVSGDKISHRLYMKQCWKLLRDHFSFISSVLLITAIWCVVKRNTVLQNSLIK